MRNGHAKRRGPGARGAAALARLPGRGEGVAADEDGFVKEECVLAAAPGGWGLGGGWDVEGWFPGVSSTAGRFRVLDETEERRYSMLSRRALKGRAVIVVSPWPEGVVLVLVLVLGVTRSAGAALLELGTWWPG